MKIRIAFIVGILLFGVFLPNCAPAIDKGLDPRCYFRPDIRKPNPGEIFPDIALSPCSWFDPSQKRCKMFYASQLCENCQIGPHKNYSGKNLKHFCHDRFFLPEHPWQELEPHEAVYLQCQCLCAKKQSACLKPNEKEFEESGINEARQKEINHTDAGEPAHFIGE